MEEVTMITKKKTIKTIVCCASACSALALTGLASLKLQQPNHEVFATGVESIPVSITNSNFNSTTNSNYPFNPSSYEAYIGNAKVNSSNEDLNITAGVINLTNEKYENKFSSAKRTSLDNYVLMIDSTKEEENKTLYHTANYGFRTSSSFSLDADSKYMFTVDVFTATDANIASIYLYDSEGKVFSSQTNIRSHNKWTTYTFFVSTNNMSSLSLKLGMYLEGAGIVLFDNISGQKLSESNYDFNKSILNSDKYVEVDKVNNIVDTYNINSQGELQNIDNLKADNKSKLIAYTELGKDSSKTVVNDSDGTFNSALLIENTKDSYVQYETIDDFFTFKQNSIYKLSINVKTKDLTGTANLKLVRTDIDEDDKDFETDFNENQNKTINITSNTVSSTNSVTNDYKTYSFLINTHPFKDVSYKLYIGLGQDIDNMAKGKMYVSQIEVSKIDYNTYNSATTGSGTEKIDFVSTYAYNNSKIRLNNGEFNAFKIADHINQMPATPVDWSVETGSGTQKHGVVNTLTFDEDLKHLNLSNLKNPNPNVNQNVLMMYNATADTLSYKSATKTLAANSYHKFEINVQTQNAPLKVALVTTKGETEFELCSKIVNTNYSSEYVTLYVHTPNQELNVALKLTLETESFGYAYVDDARFDYLLTATQLEQEFNNASNSTFTSVTDLANLMSANSTNNFASTTLFASENNASVTSGIITLKTAGLNEIIYEETDLNKFNSLNTNAVYGIRATDDVNYVTTSNIGFNLTSGDDKYYKITVYAYTQNLSSNDSSVDDKLLGASIKLSEFSESFTNIQSNNCWTPYTFYIQAKNTTTTYLELSLGSENSKTKGDVFFGNIIFDDSITAEEFNNAVSSDIVKVIKNETTPLPETTPETKNSKSSSISWIFLIPGLLTALAIIIAVVGIAIRKIKWKKPVKKSKGSYDRNKTVSIQYYTRKATTLREEKLRELKADLDKINNQRKTFEETYKQDLTKLREMKIKRANPSEIAKLEKELKKNQKLSANLGVTVNRITDEINYTKTDTYLNNLIKKLSRENNTDNKENN